MFPTLVDFFSIAYDSSASKKGVASGPERIGEYLQIKMHNIDVSKKEVEIFSSLKDNVHRSLRTGNFPVCIGGDSSIAIGSCAAFSYYSPSILWMDAYADFKKNDSPTSRCALAILNGIGDKKFTSLCDQSYSADRIHVFGARNIDDEEVKLLCEKGIKVTTISSIKRYGVDYCIRKALEKLPGKLHVSFDMHVMDPSCCKGVSMPVADGIDFEQLNTCLHHIRDCRRLSSIDMVGFNPHFDNKDDISLNCVKYIFKELQLIDM